MGSREHGHKKEPQTSRLSERDAPWKLKDYIKTRHKRHDGIHQLRKHDKVFYTAKAVNVANYSIQ